MGWPEADYDALLEELKALESRTITADLATKIQCLIGDFLEQKFEFVRVNQLPKAKLIDFIFGLFIKISDQTRTLQSSNENDAPYLFWRVCYLYISGVNSFAGRQYDWDNEKK